MNNYDNYDDHANYNNYSDEEYQLQYEERRRLERQRRRALLEKKQLMRMRITSAAILVGAGLVIFLLILGIRAIVKNVRNKADLEDAQTQQAEDMEPVLTETIPTDDTGEDDDSGGKTLQDFLGYNGTVAEGEPVVNGIKIAKGYSLSVPKTSYYIASQETQSSYAILIDAATNEVVCQREGFTRMYPASMTKILTVLVAAEHLSQEDISKNVIITTEDTDYAYVHDLSAVGWEIDEKVTVEDLFYGTVLQSGADAAIALARYVAGDEEAFVAMMNEKVEELGLQDTHFTNCVGSYDDNHYTTCADMAMILKAAIENDYVYKVMNAHKYTTSSTTVHPEGIEISNWFLRRIEDKDTGGEVLCAKTGYVHQSGSCAASYALQESGRPYICVTGNAHSAWRAIYDHVDIYYNNTD